MDLIREVLGPDAAPAPSGAGRPSQPPTTPASPEQVAAFAAAWLLRTGCRTDLHSPAAALRVGAVLAHREAAGQPPVGGRELAEFLGQRTAEDGLRGLRIVGAVRMEPRADGGRGVVYRPAGSHRPAKGPFGDVRRLNWLRRAAVDTSLPDVAIRLALLVGAAWAWEEPQAPPEAAGLASRLGVTPDEITAAWAALVRLGFLRAGIGGDGRPLLRIVDRAPAGGRSDAEDGA